MRLSNYYNRTVDYFLQDSPEISNAFLDQEIAVLVNQLNKKNKKIAIAFLESVLSMQNDKEMDIDDNE